MVQKCGFKHYDGLHKDIYSTLKLLPKRGPHLATGGNQNTGTDLSFILILPLHQFFHDTIRW